MSLNPEFIYPDRPKHFKGANDEDLGIGLTIQATPESGGSSDKKMTFKDVRIIDLTGYPEDALDINVFTFANNVELHFQNYGGSESNNTWVRFVFYYEGEMLTDIGWTSWIPLSLNLPRTAWMDLANCKLICQCLFNDPVENVTAAECVYFDILMPAYRALEVPFGTILEADLSEVENNNTAWLLSDLCTVASDDNTYQVGIGTTQAPASFPGVNFAISDLETFNTYMQTIGDYDGDIYDNEDRFDDDTSGTGGGNGGYDNTSDPIDIPDLPTGGALTSGMIKGFVISSASLEQLQNKLWDMSIFDITTQFQKLVNQPLDCLISLHCLPCLPTTGSSEEIKLGSFETGVNAIRIANQYLEISCGSLTVPKYWGSALDYAPYSQAELFLPFIGIRNIKIEDIQGLTISVVYHVDVLTGDCVAYVKCGASVMYSFTGNCLSRIPCTSSTSDLLAKGISAVGAIGVGMATGNPASTAGGVISGITNVATAKNHVQRSGDVAGSPGVMSEFKPYMIFHRPAQSLAKNYNKFKGYPTNITYTLNTLSGYTEVEHIHLTGITGATDTELNEIEQLLKSGVII